jgi:hypothetical protein
LEVKIIHAEGVSVGGIINFKPLPETVAPQDITATAASVVELVAPPSPVVAGNIHYPFTAVPAAVETPSPARAPPSARDESFLRDEEDEGEDLDEGGKEEEEDTAHPLQGDTQTSSAPTNLEGESGEVTEKDIQELFVFEEEKMGTLSASATLLNLFFGDSFVAVVN